QPAIPLVTNAKKFHPLKDRQTGFLVIDKPKDRIVTFTSPAGDFSSPTDLVLSDKLPDMCRAVLVVDGIKSEIFTSPTAIPLPPFRQLELLIEYIGSKQLVSLPVPRLNKILGQIKTPVDELNKLNIRIDDKNLPLNYKKMPPSDNSWVTLGKTKLYKGTHTIKTENTDYFEVKMLMLETNSPLPFQEAGSQQDPGSITNSLYSIGLKLSILLLVVTAIYYFRNIFLFLFNIVKRLMRIIYSSVCSMLPNSVWAALWLFGGIVLYSLGLKTKAGTEENLFFTFGGMLIVIAFFHFMKTIKQFLLKLFPQPLSGIFRSTATIFFTGAIIFLILCLLFVLCDFEPIAEQTAIIVYYMLVAGTVSELSDYKKSRMSK
ncbi:MAG: hypothetical protein GY868_04840, partial [Deltaproteobacteria bacterium]|nr:hypothetical protein [Deltaproteobacteria bacterium]